MPVSELFPVHILPPLAGAGFVHVRDLDHVPLSHDLLQVLQDDQLDHFPSTESQKNTIISKST